MAILTPNYENVLRLFDGYQNSPGIDLTAETLPYSIKYYRECDYWPKLVEVQVIYKAYIKTSGKFQLSLYISSFHVKFLEFPDIGIMPTTIIRRRRTLSTIKTSKSAAKFTQNCWVNDTKSIDDCNAFSNTSAVNIFAMVRLGHGEAAYIEFPTFRGGELGGEGSRTSRESVVKFWTSIYISPQP